ncbi:hypothetical protein [Streptomyces sedi]|uniref:Uncharacterized protein n=1 Tax=Streptomyces sedi TaxID=555059 RepID=A0A5C4VFY6_9ACTN|nr:hypothetical protein [Streptomyces sedi]TNM34495.1 hypothetical protein FH715_02155 [Streptomyces sedi]
MIARTTLKRTVIASAVAVAGAGFLFSQTANADEAETLGGMDVVKVAPYEAVEINDDWSIGLLPEGEQNYVVSDPAGFAEAVEEAKGLEGDDIDPESISLSTFLNTEDDSELFAGAWRSDQGVPHITVTPDGQDFGYGAQPLALEGEDGWGAYYFDPAAAGVEADGYTVTATDDEGNVIDEVHVGAEEEK